MRIPTLVLCLTAMLLPLSTASGQSFSSAFQEPIQWTPGMIHLPEKKPVVAIPRFYFAADALSLNLDRPVHQPIVLDSGSQAAMLSTGDLGFDAEIGPRLTLGVPLLAVATVELSYFGFHDWDAAATVTGAGNLQLPGDLGPHTIDFSAADQMQAAYGAELHNFELNALYPLGTTNLAILGGFRYLYLTEDCSLWAGSGSGQPSVYRIHTRNNVVGTQLGLRLRLEFGIFACEILGKTGAYGTKANEHTFLGDAGNTLTLRDVGTSDSEWAVVSEVGLNVTMKVFGFLRLRGGYNLFWIDGLARAPDQFDFTNIPASGSILHDEGSAFLHGWHAGLEARW